MTLQLKSQDSCVDDHLIWALCLVLKEQVCSSARPLCGRALLHVSFDGRVPTFTVLFDNSIANTSILK